MDRTVWIIISVVAIAIAGFLGFRVYRSGQFRSEQSARAVDLEKELESTRQSAKEAARKADLAAEARRLAELKQQQENEAESRRLAQTQAEREAYEMARKRADDDAARSAKELERIRAENAQLSAEARRLAALREREAADAQAKLDAAQRALADSEQKKNAEIERQAALIASYNHAPEAGATTDEETRRQLGARIIYPSDYKRSSHYYLPLLPWTGAQQPK